LQRIESTPERLRCVTRGKRFSRVAEKAHCPRGIRIAAPAPDDPLLGPR
jgi:hypothetical protein